MTPDRDREMPFLEHLRELRSCTLRALAGLGVAALLCLFFADYLFAFLTQPLRDHFGNAQLIGTGPAEAFIVKLKAALMAGVILSSPYSFLQLWRFVSPGLYDNERKVALPFVAISTIFFLAGISFCFYVIFPFAFAFFFDEFESIGVLPTIKIGEYLSFCIKLLLVFGLVFELPVLSYFLARFRLITHTWLIKQFRYAVVVIFVAAAALTPPDAITQVLLALPLMVMYGLCIAVAYFVETKRLEASAQPNEVLH